MKRGTRNHEAVALSKARQFRTEMSSSERILWFLMRKRQLGFLFKRQVPTGPYVLDFYCPEASLCVEVDGEQHQFTQVADLRRDQWLQHRGVDTIRIPSLDLFEQSTKINRWLETIQSACVSRTSGYSTPNPSSFRSCLAPQGGAS